MNIFRSIFSNLLGPVSSFYNNIFYSLYPTEVIFIDNLQIF